MNLTEKIVRYSPGERRLLALLSDKPISSDVLSAKFYKEQMPFHGRKIIIGLISSIQRKVEVNKELFSVMKSDRKGPHPIEIWVKKRKS